MRFETFGWVGAVVLAAGLFFGQPEQSRAALSYAATQSSATITHDPDLGVAGVPPLQSPTFVATTNYKLTPKTNPKTFSPTSTLRDPKNGYDFATKHAVGTSNSQATASVAHIASTSTAGVKLAAGTGVSQVNKGAYTNNPQTGGASLRIDIDMLWNNNSQQFGPPVSGIGNFVVGGSVGANPGSFAAFEAVLHFEDPDAFVIGLSDEVSVLGPSFGQYRSTMTFQDEWRRGDADVSGTGAFSKTFSSSQLFTSPFLTGPNGVVLPFDRLHIWGYIEFTAFNASTTTAPFAQALVLPPLDEDVAEGTVINFERTSGVAATTNDELVLDAIPEPATAGLAGMSLLALAGGVLRRRR